MLGKLGFLSVLLVASSAITINSVPDHRYFRHSDYSGQAVVRCESALASEVARLEEQGSVDVWGHHADGTIDVRVLSSSSSLSSCTPLVNDLEEVVREWESTAFAARANASWFEEFHTYDELVGWYKQAAQDHSDVMSFVPSIGKSVEGRDMPAVHITGTKSGTKSQVYFQCQIHAREWISSAVCNFIVNHLITNYGKDQAVTDLLDRTRLSVLVFTNPDGYEYTWKGDRMWRKNRRKDVICHGVDLNRNFADHWNQGGSSGNPCSDTYHGKSAASEPETQV